MRIFGRSSKPDIRELYSLRDIDGLIQALNHKEVEVKREAADALGKIGDARAIEPLMEAFRGHKGNKFSAGDRVTFNSKEYPRTNKPHDYPEKIILEYGKKASVIGEACYRGTNSRLVIVRWDADSYRIYGDMVLIPTGGVKYLHKGVAKIDSFLSVIAFDTIAKIN